jgi:UDP-N-acetyl-D-glucosamine dehydrogenase
MRTLHYKTRMIGVADEINSEMPAFWVRKVQDALNDRGIALKGAKVMVLGVAYKKDIDDMRESPALEIMDLLAQKGAAVRYHDPFCPEIVDDGHTPAGAVGKSVPLTDESLSGADAVMIVTDHSDIDYGRVKKTAKVLVDTRAAAPRTNAPVRRAAATTA